MSNHYLGLDFGTSGVRGVVIDDNEQVIVRLKTLQSGYGNSDDWKDALYSLLAQIPVKIAQTLQSIAIDGTSSTVVLCDRQGELIADVLWYNDDRGKKYLSQLSKFVPENNICLSATSSLAKLYYYYQEINCQKAAYLLHQADWIGFLLHGKLGISDYHNALKLGFDVVSLSYPQWLQNKPFAHLLPDIKTPGETIGYITTDIAKKYHLNPYCVVKAGTTDSIGAFLASGVGLVGEALTSLGSTLVIKLLSNHKIDDRRYGIYSHKFGNLWLVGGASNTGGAVLKHFFNDDELDSLSQKINPHHSTNLNYYPLLTKGDRFPINNPNLEPKLIPRPNNPATFLQGLLEGIANIETQGYQLLTQLGANPLIKVYTAGGGAKNEPWRLIRQHKLKVPVIASTETEASFGTALLAKNGLV
jgi:D-ribulokinase